MMNWELIADAVILVQDTYDENGFYEAIEQITDRAIDWYNHTEITDRYQLAAVTMDGMWDNSITIKDILEITEYWFPFYWDSMTVETAIAVYACGDHF